jgi:(heptosyl)LPS beta-1,4-glucosyltransferase
MPSGLSSTPSTRQPPRLGGFVIHGEATETLARCLDDLVRVCDEVVAVDSGSGRGGAALAAARGVRRVVHRWEGFGAARATAVEQLRGCDYLLFLDSDERLDAQAVEALARWRASAPDAPYYSIPVRDWAVLDGRRFLYRVEHHVRIVRADHASWTPEMIVHEALPPARTVRLDDVVVEHDFARSVTALEAKGDHYALLWALRHARTGRRAKSGAGQRPWHVIRDCLLKGGVFRGGLSAVRLSWAVSRYHAAKYEYLTALRAGAASPLLEAYATGRYGAVFDALRDAPAPQPAPPPPAAAAPPPAIAARLALAARRLGTTGASASAP